MSLGRVLTKNQHIFRKLFNISHRQTNPAENMKQEKFSLSLSRKFLVSIIYRKLVGYCLSFKRHDFLFPDMYMYIRYIWQCTQRTRNALSVLFIDPLSSSGKPFPVGYGSLNTLVISLGRLMFTVPEIFVTPVYPVSNLQAVRRPH